MKKIFITSIALTTFAAGTILFQMASCKKAEAQTSCPTPTYQVAGLWIGTYSVNTIPSQGQLFYSFVIYPDGRLLTEGKGGDGISYYSAGTWKLSNSNIFSATIKTFVTPNAGSPVTQTITGTYSNTGVITNASWKDTNNPYGKCLAGQFSIMQRVN